MKKYAVLFVVLLNGLFANASSGNLTDKQALKLLIENSSKLKIENALAYELPEKVSDLLVGILLNSPQALVRELLVNSGCTLKGAEQICRINFIIAEETQEENSSEVERGEVAYMLKFKVINQNGTLTIKDGKVSVDIAG